MKKKAYAKINIGLLLGEKLNNKKHLLNTIICPISLFDKIIIKKSKYFLIKTNCEIKDNILYKVLNYFIKNYNITPIKIILKKHIPIASGLGGGSSDASCLINMLLDYFKIDLTLDEKIEIARTFGSDTVFSLFNKPAYCFYDGTKIRHLDKTYKKKIMLIIFKKKVLSSFMFDKIKEIKIKEIDTNCYINDFYNYFKTAKNDFLKYLLEDKYFLNIYNRIIKISNNIKLTGSGPSFYLIDYKKSEYIKIKKELKKENIQLKLCKMI